jgi:hypothetical protein
VFGECARGASDGVRGCVARSQHRPFGAGAACRAVRTKPCARTGRWASYSALLVGSA